MNPNTPARTSQTTPGATPENHDGSLAVIPAKPGKLLRLPKVLDLVPLQKSAWYGLVRIGKAPRPVRLGSRAVAWREEDVLSWIAARATTEGATA